eukprot:scaffold3504_cov240-Pinguiococcus_pyrenoidosus.AAC.32
MAAQVERDSAEVEVRSAAAACGLGCVAGSDRLVVQAAEELETLSDTLAEAERLSLVQDPDGEPFKSKYQALRLLQRAKELLQGAEEEHGRDLRDLQRRIGALHLATEDFAAADEALTSCITMLAPELVQRVGKLSGDDEAEDAQELPPEIVLGDQELQRFRDELETVWDCLNLLGLLWSQRDRPRRSLLYLLVAERLSVDADVSNDTRAPSDGDPRLLSLLNHTNYYLAQVYSNLGQLNRAAKYIQVTLEQQLVTRDSFSPLEWAKNCMGLSDFCLMQRRFLETSKCLQASRHIIRSVEGDAGEEEETMRKTSLLADLDKRWASVAAELLQAVVDKEFDAELPVVAGDGPRRVEFRSLPAEPVPILLTPREIITFESARDIYKFGERACLQALQHYQLDGYVTNHVRIMQLRSRLLGLLSKLEEDASRVAAMNTKRCGLLAPLLSQLSATHYAHLLKEISFEVGSLQSDLVDFRAKRVEKRQRHGKAPKSGDVVALNRAAAAAIIAFESFAGYYQKPQPGCCMVPTYSNAGDLESLGEENVEVIEGVIFPPLRSLIRRGPPRSIDFPADLHASDVGPLWRAYFHIARMWGRTVSPTPQQRVEVLSQALQLYEALPAFAQGLVERIDKDEAEGVTVPGLFEQEIEICTQMAGLLPIKMSRVQHDGVAALGPAL